MSKMMKIDVCDVSGDGNCFYRCIWNIVKHSFRIKYLIGLENCTCEEDAIKKIRRRVAMQLRHSKSAQEHLRNIWTLAQEVDDLDEEYPIVNAIRAFTSFDDNVVHVAAHTIAETTIMASSLEHSIIQQILHTVHFIVVSSNGRKQPLRKWVTCLRTQIEHSTKRFVAILINMQNIHYKYVRINGNTVVKTDSILQHSRGRQ